MLLCQRHRAARCNTAFDNIARRFVWRQYTAQSRSYDCSQFSPGVREAVRAEGWRLREAFSFLAKKLPLAFGVMSPPRSRLKPCAETVSKGCQMASAALAAARYPTLYPPPIETGSGRPRSPVPYPRT